jgi:shikimate dehydrogenase
VVDRYAVIGNPVEHSKSPVIHAAFARATGEQLIYDRILCERDRFVATVDAFRAAGGRGLNVTLPFKEEAFRHATRHSPRARAAEAVNTLRFDADGVFGDNTDGPGLVTDVRDNRGVAITGARVLIAGAGGATRGVIPSILAERPARLVVANRTAERAVDLARFFGAGVTGCGYADLAGERFDIVVNATSASLAGELPPVPPAAFADARLAYDMMYGKGETPFLAHARACGARVLADGLGMLVEQAAESFLVWRGVRPRTAAVLETLRAA